MERRAKSDVDGLVGRLEYQAERGWGVAGRRVLGGTDPFQIAPALPLAGSVNNHAACWTLMHPTDQQSAAFSTCPFHTHARRQFCLIINSHVNADPRSGGSFRPRCLRRSATGLHLKAVKEPTLMQQRSYSQRCGQHDSQRRCAPRPLRSPFTNTFDKLVNAWPHW